MTFRLLLISAPLFLCPCLQAGLDWEKPWQEFTRMPGDAPVETSYAFRNSGDTPVTISSVKTTCGCTTARLEKKTYAPGESGQIEVKFDFGTRKGPHRKMVIVQTDGQSPATELNIVVNVEDPLTVSTALVFWRIGESNEPKTVELTANPAIPVRALRATSSNPRFTARLETVEDGKRYRLTIQPAETAGRESAKISVETDFPREKPRVLTIHARVK